MADVAPLCVPLCLSFRQMSAFYCRKTAYQSYGKYRAIYSFCHSVCQFIQ